MFNQVIKADGYMNHLVDERPDCHVTQVQQDLRWFVIPGM